MADRLAYLVLFFIGWISGGGILAILGVWLLTILIGDTFNSMFVGGCLWGTFGVWMGNFMVNFIRKERSGERNG